MAPRRQRRRPAPRNASSRSGGVPGPLRPQRRQTYTCSAGRGSAPTAPGSMRPGRLVQRHLRRVLRWDRTGRGRRAHPRAARISDMTSASRSRGRPRHGERDRVPVFGRCETLAERGEAGHRAPHVRPMRRPRRDPDDSSDDAGPDGQRQRLPEVPGRGQDRDRPMRDVSRRGRPSGKRSLRVSIPAGIDVGTPIRLSNEGEIGVRAGPQARSTSRSMSRPTEVATRGNRSSTTPRCLIAQAALGTRCGTTVDGDEEIEIRPAGTGHQGPPPRRGVPTCGGPARKATSTCSSTSWSRRSSRSGSASCWPSTLPSRARASRGGRDLRQGSASAG